MPVSAQTNSTADAQAALRSSTQRGNASRRRIRRALAATVRRTFDIFAAAVVMIVLAPLLVSLITWRSSCGRPFSVEPRLGQRRRVFHVWRILLGDSAFAARLSGWGFDRIPIWFNVLSGDMALVGPRAVSPDEPALPGAGSRRFLVKPGLVCLWWIRQRTNIAFGAEWDADNEYVASRSLRGDAGILLRAAIAGLYGARQTETAECISLFELPIANITMTEAVRRMVTQLGSDEPRRACFINADCVNLSFRHADYRARLHDSWMNLSDGIGMKLAGRAFGRDIRENICGTDLFLCLCDALADTDKSLYLLGAKPGVVEALHEWMAAKYPNTRVAGTRNGYFTKDEEPQVIADIAASKADVLLVAFGAPRQDVWVAENLAATGVKLAMGVGGLFDYYSGAVPRAPQWVREIGMEWAFRLVQEPRRLWKRYLCGNVVFLARLVWWKLRGTRIAGGGTREV